MFPNKAKWGIARGEFTPTKKRSRVDDGETSEFLNKDLGQAVDYEAVILRASCALRTSILWSARSAYPGGGNAAEGGRG